MRLGRLGPGSAFDRRGARADEKRAPIGALERGGQGRAACQPRRPVRGRRALALSGAISETLARPLLLSGRAFYSNRP
jgi:hypothetical protein